MLTFSFFLMGQVQKHLSISSVKLLTKKVIPQLPRVLQIGNIPLKKYYGTNLQYHKLKPNLELPI